MGHKVNPISFRTGIYRRWGVEWYPGAGANYADMVLEDIQIMKFVRENFPEAEIAHIEIEKGRNNAKVVIHSARPGVVIGKQGREIESIRKRLAEHLKRDNVEVTVQEVKIPELSAALVAKSIADQIERRANYKKLMKKAAASALRSGAKGVKIRVAGRLAGAEIARDEWLRVGQTPLHTLRSNIDYGTARAMTKYGIIGIKVWICLGDYKISKQTQQQQPIAAVAA